MFGTTQDESTSPEPKTIKLGHATIELGKVYPYTYPTVISRENYILIDAYLESAKMFNDYLNGDAPDYMRDNADQYWKNFVNYLIFISKHTSNRYGIVMASLDYNVLCKMYPIDLSKFHFTFDEMVTYQNTVYWYVSRINTGDSVGYEMVSPKGKILKRLKNHLYKSLSQEYPDVFWQFLGNLVKGFTCEPSKTIYWRVTDNLEWADGSFGDDGSCMVSVNGSYRNGLRNLIDNGAYAVQFFSSETPKYRMDHNKGRKKYTNGMGRAWLISLNSSGDFLIVNGYGEDVLAAYSSSSKCTDKIADILSSHVGIDYKQVDFVIRPDNAMYVNDGGTCKYFPMDQSFDKSYLHYAFNNFTDEPDSDNDDDPEDDFHFHCENCGGRFDQEDENFVENYGSYCHTCYSDLFTTCDHCEEVVSRDALTEVHNGDYVCEYCLREHYTICYDCDEYYLNDDTSLVYDHGNERYLCADCLESGEYSPCDQCGEIHDNITMHELPILPITVEMGKAVTAMYCSVCVNLRRD